MKEQKKNKREKQIKTNNFQTLDLTQKQLMKRWIWATIGLILLLIIIIIFLVFFFKGDITIPGIPQFAKNTQTDSSQGSLSVQKEIREHMQKYDNYNYEELYQAQISKPKIGEEIAAIYLQGTDKPIKVKFFEKDAPEIVKQFKGLVNKGFYNNKSLYSEKDEVLKTIIADERVNWGTLGEPSNKEQEEKVLKSIETWETLEVKTNKVLPYNGALCAYDMIIRDEGYGVNFFVLNMDSKRVVDYTDLNIPVNLQNLFNKHGSGFNYVPNHSFRPVDFYKNPTANLLEYVRYPTFAQVFEGMELIENMTKESKEFKINKIEIIRYGE